MNILQPVAAEWKALGLQLGVPIGELKNIACTPANAAAGPTACLRDMLTKWLETTSTPNLTSLSVALRCDSVQEKRLADELKEKYMAYKVHTQILLDKISLTCAHNPDTLFSMPTRQATSFFLIMYTRSAQ